jgi:histidyl-tRNA synthetase
MKIQSVRGFRDILPGEIEAWHTIEAAAREVFELYGYSEIRTPVLEKVELFSRSVGEDTDIVQKEMYVIENKREGNMAMRPEGTASVVRAYNEHALHATRPVPEKLYYILPMFRHERPQAGRFRQFHQIGAEALGIDSPAIDAEIIAMVFNLLQKLHVSGIELQLNSVGCQQCRPGYREKLQEYLRNSSERLCADCCNRVERNPMRVLDCKKEACQAIVAFAPVMLEHYCQECHRHFSELREFLEILDVPFDVNPRIVRGLDYYVRTAFEFISSSLGAQNALLGGGRYDGLSEDIGGPPLPGVGFAMGIERLLSLAQLHPENRPLEVFIAILGASARKSGFSLQKDLRNAGIRTEFEYQDKRLKSQMKKAGKLGVSYVILIGEEELQKGMVILRNMAESSQDEVAITEIVKTLVNVLRNKNG